MPARILYIVPPSSSVKEAGDATAEWTGAWITADEKKRYLNAETKGLFFEQWESRDDFVGTTSREGFFPVYLNETLIMAIRWSQKPGIQLKILSFHNFAAIVLLSDEALKTLVSGWDIVYGGCEYTIDTVEASHFKNRRDEEQFILRMDNLSQSVFVWPPARQSLFYREKLKLADHLDRVAKFITLTSRPRTFILDKVTDFTDETVLKREGSCQSNHRHFYDNASGPSLARTSVQQNTKILNKRKRDPNGLQAQRGMLWLLQDLVPELRTCGEYRVYVVGGKVVSVVGTTPMPGGLWLVKDCYGVYSLTELRDAFKETPKPHDVLVRRGGIVDQRSEAMQALREYVLKTVGGLVAEAELLFPEPSVLRDFARVDVSFMKRPNGEDAYDYFVNEVELGGNGVCFFSAYSEHTEVIMDELLEALLARYRDRHEAIGQVQPPHSHQPVKPMLVDSLDLHSSPPNPNPKKIQGWKSLTSRPSGRLHFVFASPSTVPATSPAFPQQLPPVAPALCVYLC
ncbi:hypothetical protein B0H19DRAFT_1263809 [Mycena capillaripes]|nr:hypothetical protein B0H19DRAFT_1263809 [Mycena capillaripes]